MRTAIYARVSTKLQSNDLQLEALRSFAKARDWEITAECIDFGVSGAKDSRPELNKLMELARKRKIDMVAVYKFDRFARSLRHLLIAVEEFKALGIGFVSYSEQFDTSTPMGQAMLSVIGAMAQLERDLIRERVKAGVNRAITNGKEWGRKPLELDFKSVSDLSLRKAAAQLNCSYQTVLRARKIL